MAIKQLEKKITEAEPICSCLRQQCEVTQETGTQILSWFLVTQIYDFHASEFVRLQTCKLGDTATAKEKRFKKIVSEAVHYRCYFNCANFRCQKSVFVDMSLANTRT